MQYETPVLEKRSLQRSLRCVLRSEQKRSSQYWSVVRKSSRMNKFEGARSAIYRFAMTTRRASSRKANNCLSRSPITPQEGQVPRGERKVGKEKMKSGFAVAELTHYQSLRLRSSRQASELLPLVEEAIGRLFLSSPRSAGRSALKCISLLTRWVFTGQTLSTRHGHVRGYRHLHHLYSQTS